MEHVYVVARHYFIWYKDDTTPYFTGDIVAVLPTKTAAMCYIEDVVRDWEFASDEKEDVVDVLKSKCLTLADLPKRFNWDGEDVYVCEIEGPERRIYIEFAPVKTPMYGGYSFTGKPRRGIWSKVARKR